MSFSSTVLALPGLLAYYRHGEASGDVMVDSSGNARDGVYRPAPKHPTLGTTGLLVGDADTAISFDGTDDVAITGYQAWMDTTTIGLFARIKPTSVTGTRDIHARDTGTGGAGPSRLWQFRINAGKLQATFWDSGGTLNSVTGATTLVAGTTYSVGFDYNGTTAKLYLNGVEDGSLARSGALRTASPFSQLFTVGIAGDESSNKYAGVIDETVWCGQAIGASGHAQLHADATGSAPAPVALAANLTATASLTAAAPKVTTHLAAALSAESNLTADLVNPAAPISLAATLSAVSSLTAALTAQGLVSLAASLSAETTLAADLAMIPVVLAQTDTADRNNGRTRGGIGYPTVDYADPVDDTVWEPIRIMVQSVPPPNLDEGKPT